MCVQDRKKAEKGEQISIEDLVERERAALGHNTTKVTLTTFLAWKKKKLKEKEAAEKKKTDKKKSDYKSGKEGGVSYSGGFLLSVWYIVIWWPYFIFNLMNWCPV